MATRNISPRRTNVPSHRRISLGYAASRAGISRTTSINLPELIS
jgi:hypothetical protein